MARPRLAVGGPAPVDEHSPPRERRRGRHLPRGRGVPLGRGPAPLQGLGVEHEEVVEGSLPLAAKKRRDGDGRGHRKEAVITTTTTFVDGLPRKRKGRERRGAAAAHVAPPKTTMRRSKRTAAQWEWRQGGLPVTGARDHAIAAATGGVGVGGGGRRGERARERHGDRGRDCSALDREAEGGPEGGRPLLRLLLTEVEHEDVVEARLRQRVVPAEDEELAADRRHARAAEGREGGRGSAVEDVTQACISGLRVAQGVSPAAPTCDWAISSPGAPSVRGASRPARHRLRARGRGRRRGKACQRRSILARRNPLLRSERPRRRGARGRPRRIPKGQRRAVQPRVVATHVTPVPGLTGVELPHDAVRAQGLGDAVGPAVKVAP